MKITLSQIPSSNMKRYKKYIIKGVNEPLSKVPFHSKAPIKRLAMLGLNKIPQANTHLAVHFVDAENKKIDEYSELHKHSADEINLIISENGKLVYEVQLDEEIYKVTSPATVYIPKGIRHRAKVISGKGVFVCLILSNKYKSSK
jgi:mannose-6-phosphate isomerase-like protein (cupin superfamily)